MHQSFLRMQILPHFEFGWPLLVFCLFTLFICVNLFFTLFVYGRFAFFKQKKEASEINYPPLSVILAARNESDNLYENLPIILEQDYPEFEVIIINNQSTDDSTYLLEAIAQQYTNLRVIEVMKNQHLKPGKKLSITLGVKGAKFEHLILTDADCRPASRNWLKSIAENFSNEKQIILGYGPYKKEKGFLNRLIRFDTTWIGMSYFSMALAKLPYMGVGRNLAYTKTVFNSVSGFKSHYYLPSGDDDLFIQETAKNNNYTIAIKADSFCYSEGHTSWKSWIRQKTRHFTTTDKYNVIKKWMLGIYPLSLLLMLISFVTLLIVTDYKLVALFVFLPVLLLKWWIQARCFFKLQAQKFIPYLPLWDLFYAFVMPVIYYSTDKKKKTKW